MKLTKLLDVYCAQNRKIRSPKTVSVYRTALKQLAIATGQNLFDLSLLDLNDDNLIRLETYLLERGRSEFTSNERVGRIKSLWTWAAKRKMVDVWPTVDRLPVKQPPPRAWTISELSRLFTACKLQSGKIGDLPASEWWYSLHLVAWETSERTGALLSMPTSAIEQVRRGLEVPGGNRKGGEPAFHALSAKTLELLTVFSNGRQTIWPLPTGRKRSRSQFWTLYSALLRSAGLPDHRRNKLQKLRRTSLTFWAANGGDATLRAGHASSSTTERHYLDRTLLPMERPEHFLPQIEVK